MKVIKPLCFGCVCAILVINGILMLLGLVRPPDDTAYAMGVVCDGIGGDAHPVTHLPMGRDTDDLLDIYMAVIFMEPEIKFPFWNERLWGELLLQRTIWVEELLHIHANGSREDMIAWFLSYEEAVANMFPPSLPSGVIMYAGRDFSLPELEGHSFTYMPIRTITSPSSHQFRFKPHLIPNERHFMTYGAAYAVALGSYFGITIGGIYEIEFANGEVIYAVLGDVKRDSETDPTNRFHPTPGTSHMRTGNIVEFIMDDSPWSHLSFAERVAPINQVVRERFPYAPVRITFIGVSEHAVIR